MQTMKRKRKEKDIETTKQDTILIDNVTRQKAFYQYYSNLHKGEDISLEKIDEYLNNIYSGLQRNRNRLSMDL